MSDFINNPSKEELEENLTVASQIEYYRSKGYKVYFEGNKVYYKDGLEKYEIGTLSNLSETTSYLFGDTIPEEVEYITLDDITMMTYSGSVVACGTLGENTKAESVYTINKIINDSYIVFAVKNYIHSRWISYCWGRKYMFYLPARGLKCLVFA